MTDDIDIEAMSAWFAYFADHEFAGRSPLYQRLAHEAADSPETLVLMRGAATSDRYPMLLFAAVSYLLHADNTDPIAAFATAPVGTFREWCAERRDELEELVATRVVQTNEVGRCAGVLPCLAHVAATSGQQLALIEVGASAGLNLNLDRYRYRYGDTAVGPASALTIAPELRNCSVAPFEIPEISWRIGLDRNPVDITHPDARAWLRACIWPEHDARRDALDRAFAVAQEHPPMVTRGDAVDALPELIASAPSDLALCISHTAFLGYLPEPARFAALLVEAAADRQLWWISGEMYGSVSALGAVETPPNDPHPFVHGVVALGTPASLFTPTVIAIADGHARWIEVKDAAR